MLSLSPAKLLVILVVGVIVLGPDKLPQVARQVGALWGDVRRWRKRLEDEVRGSFPDLPPTAEVVRAVRSPISFLDRLADAHERDGTTTASASVDVGSVVAPAGGAIAEGRHADAISVNGVVANTGSADTTDSPVANGSSSNGSSSNGSSVDRHPLPDGTDPGPSVGAPWTTIGLLADLPDDPNLN